MSIAWRAELSSESDDRQRDSVEFLESALSKWRLYEARKRTAASKGQLMRLISKAPAIDALAILSVRAPWANLGKSLGICQFRRTWRNSIVIDYLAVHPSLLKPPKIISGVGTALLYAVAVVANNLSATRLWLETTDLSANYYSVLLGTDKMSDLIIVPTPLFYAMLRKYFTTQAPK